MRIQGMTLVLIAATLAAVAWATRLEVVNVGQGAFYLVDRWTGAVTLVTPAGQTDIPRRTTPPASDQ